MRRISLALHEAGHAIVAAAFGLSLEEDCGIEMDYKNGNGAVYYEDGYEKKISVEQRTVLALAGLAAERYFQKDLGVVYWTEKVTENFYKVHGPKEKGLANEEGTGDLNTVHELMPEGVRFTKNEEEWCNRHLKAAWDLLHENEEAFLKLYEVLHPRSKHKHGEQVHRHFDVWNFYPDAIAHILVKVRTRKAAA